MLTAKQHELLRFIHDRLEETGISPSFEEMKDALDLKSKSGVHRLISALEERGFIRRLAHRARAIEIVKLPESLGGQPAGFSPKVIEGDRPDAPPPPGGPGHPSGWGPFPAPHRLVFRGILCRLLQAGGSTRTGL